MDVGSESEEEKVCLGGEWEHAGPPDRRRAFIVGEG